MIADLNWDRIPETKTYGLRGYAERFSDNNTYHILLIGGDKVGKSSYINNIIHTDFKHIPTVIEGITLSLLISGKDLIMIWTIPTEKNIIDNIGGKINEMDGVLGMFDLVNETTFQELVDHIGYLIRAYGKMYPLLLIGNKADSQARVVSKEDILVYAYEMGNCSCHRVPYAEMSAINNIGVDLVIDNLITMINCNLMEKCSEMPALTRNWCKVPQFYSFHEEPREKLEVIK